MASPRICGDNIKLQLIPHLSTPKGWKAELADLQRMVYPHKWSPVSCWLSAGQRKLAGQRPTFYHSATEPTVELKTSSMQEMMRTYSQSWQNVRTDMQFDCRHATRCSTSHVHPETPSVTTHPDKLGAHIQHDNYLSEFCIPASSVNYLSHRRSTHQDDRTVPRVRLVRCCQQASDYAASYI